MGPLGAFFVFPSKKKTNKGAHYFCLLWYPHKPCEYLQIITMEIVKVRCFKINLKGHHPAVFLVILLLHHSMNTGNSSSFMHGDAIFSFQMVTTIFLHETAALNQADLVESE